MGARFLNIVIAWLVVAVLCHAVPQYAPKMRDIDGNMYQTVKIGNQIWMAENLKVDVNGSFCYDDNLVNCDKYGRLYVWDAAQGACPTGWRIPSKAEMQGLVKATSKDLKSSDWGGEDLFGISIYPGLRYKDGTFGYQDREAGLWTSTTSMGNFAFYLFVDDRDAYVKNGSKDIAMSVRCLIDANDADENAFYLGEVDDVRRKVHPLEEKSQVVEDEFANGFSTMTDARDDKIYRIVKIGDHVWMAQNLDYKVKESWCYNKKKSNCKKYGRLYSWDAAQEVCPTGWHLPTEPEFKDLLAAVGSSDNARSMSLKASSWANGSDEFGFSAVPAGHRFEDGNFYGLGVDSYWWGSTENSSYRASSLRLVEDDVGLDHGVKRDAFSVRCVRDYEKKYVFVDHGKDGENTAENISTSEDYLDAACVAEHEDYVVDCRDGKTYSTVKKGERVWMAENLNYATRYSICYDNNQNYCDSYGRLYTWSDAQDACPEGYRIPTIGELMDFVSSDITALLAGSYNGRYFYNMGYYAYFWSSTEEDDEAYYVRMENGDVDKRSYYKYYARSVRCVKGPKQEYNDDEQPMEQKPSIEYGSLRDFRDGKTYKTVKIGNRTWMAENLNYKTRESWCYDNNQSNCNKYGRLYTWIAARNACPEGWYLPSGRDLETLLDSVGCTNEDRGENLRVESWGNGTDLYGFSAIHSGSYNSYFKDFRDFDGNVCYWSATENDGGRAYNLFVNAISADIRYDSKLNGLSVRCVQGQKNVPNAPQTRGVLKLLSAETKNVNSGKSRCNDRRVKADGGFEGVATKAKGSIKTPSERDVDIDSDDGSRSAADIMKVVRQRTPGLRHIYIKFLKKKPGFAGKVTLKVLIASSGEITSISIASSTTGFGKFDNEIKSAVSHWKFGTVKSGNTSVTIPFFFSE
ncbi:MAG: TonB family protein [Fibrobacter sp.]|nr:TonB family protein [Fibrobacter sp.]